MEHDLVGKTLASRYRIESKLGQGGFGVTYKAIDIHIPKQRDCVVKHFKPKRIQPQTAEFDKAKEFFAKEAAFLYELGNQHDQIPKLFAEFEEGGEFYLVQEFIDGENLNKEIIANKKLEEKTVVQLLKEILIVLKFIHDNKVIHRDLNPNNLMRRKKDGKIVIIDFGAVKQISVLEIDDQGQTSTTVAIGTQDYMPPEQRDGKPKLCSDVYAVGIICIQALTGLKPNQLLTDRTTGEFIWQHDCTISKKFADIITKMVRNQFNQRYESATEVLKDIELLLLLYENEPIPEIYKVLGAYLETKRWEEADKETVRLMLEIAGRTQERFMDAESLRRFPCDVLCTIDALWVKYSDDCFGFSVQHRIWKEVGGNPNANKKVYEEFAKSLGWWKSGDWLWYTNLRFDFDNPNNVEKGHLPSGRVGEIALIKRITGKFGGFGLQRIKILAEKLAECGIESI